MSLKSDLTEYESSESQAHFLRICTHIDYLQKKEDLKGLQQIHTKKPKLLAYLDKAKRILLVSSSAKKENDTRKSKMKTQLQRIESLFGKKELSGSEAKEIINLIKEISIIRTKIKCDQEFYNLDAKYVRFADMAKKRGLK